MFVQGTMQSLNYGQFDGTIQALIAQDKYMVLTFCLDRLFSIILTREPKILAIEVRLGKISLELEIQKKMFQIVLLLRTCKIFAFY